MENNYGWITLLAVLVIAGIRRIVLFKIILFFQSKERSETKLISILEEIRSYVTDDSEMIYTYFETPLELREEINKCIAGINSKDKNILDVLNLHFAVTGNFQEHSIQNGWSKRYLELAERFDSIYKKLKNNLPVNR